MNYVFKDKLGIEKRLTTEEQQQLLKDNYGDMPDVIEANGIEYTKVRYEKS
jgi:hypothetical protein